MTELLKNLPRACALLTLSGLTLAAAERVTGQTVTFNGAPVQTWATLDAQGAVTQVGFTLPYAAALNAPSMAGMDMAHPEIVVANVPPVVRDTTFIDHIELDWMPQGHDPARYLTPHFDFHFYGVGEAAVAAVDCQDATQPNPADLPPGWTPPAPPQLPDPRAACVPHMGYHAMPATEFGERGPKPGLFDKVMVAGYYGGKFTFVEPMVSRAALLQKADFSLPVPQPKSVGKVGLYPSTLNVTFDQAANAYQFVLSGFKAAR